MGDFPFPNFELCYKVKVIIIMWIWKKSRLSDKWNKMKAPNSWIQRQLTLIKYLSAISGTRKNSSTIEVWNWFATGSCIKLNSDPYLTSQINVSSDELKVTISGLKNIGKIYAKYFIKLKQEAFSINRCHWLLSFLTQ